MYMDFCMNSFSFIIFWIIVVVGVVVVYKETRRLKSPLRERIRDICTIGLILFTVDTISNRFMKEHSFVLAGLIIYGYGQLLLLANEFRKGEKESKNRR